MNSVSGLCYGTAVGTQACVASCGAAGMSNYYVAGSREVCTNTNSLCQPLGTIGDTAAMGACIPQISGCAPNFWDEDIICPAGSFGCDSGACSPASVLSCVTAVDILGTPTAFAATGTQCVVDRDLDGGSDADEIGFCVPTGVGSVTVCRPDCSGGTCDASDGIGGAYYCQELEADGTGLLLDLWDNGVADGSAGHPRPNDIAACIPSSDSCLTDSDCPAATSVGCDEAQGVCLTPSLTACSAGGIPGQAAPGTICDADGDGTANDGMCTTDSGVQVCLDMCTPNGTTAADCDEASVQCVTVSSNIGICTGL
jgi:hypothetical protein